MRAKKTDPDRSPVSVHRQQPGRCPTFKKYMRAKKETVDCISEPVLVGEERSITLKAKWNDKSHHLEEGGVPPTHRRQMEACSIRASPSMWLCALWLFSPRVCRLFWMPGRRYLGDKVDVWYNPCRKQLFFHKHKKSQVQFLRLPSRVLSAVKSPRGETLKSEPLIYWKLENRLKCVSWPKAPWDYFPSQEWTVLCVDMMTEGLCLNV